MALPAILAGIGGAVVATLRFTENKIVAFFLMVAFLMVDGGLSLATGWQGVSGALFTFVLNGLGIPIIVYAWQVLILLVFAPVFFYALNH